MRGGVGVAAIFRASPHHKLPRLFERGKRVVIAEHGVNLEKLFLRIGVGVAAGMKFSISITGSWDCPSPRGASMLPSLDIRPPFVLAKVRGKSTVAAAGG